MLNPYPSWLSPGDNAWQLLAATLVGLMSIPGIAVLYGGIVHKKWVVNTMTMAFTAFASVLIVWVLWAFKMGFGTPIHLGPGILSQFIGHPGTVLGHLGEQAKANIPLVSGIGAMPGFRFPSSTLVYFQFVFAAITPLLFLGSVLGRMSFKAWAIFVPLWTTFIYSVNAFLIWGGGFFAAKGAVDYSGGYVIHLAAGVSGFVAAAVIGPRLRRDRETSSPTNLLLVAVGAGILWLGWNGFNGGDPYFAGADAASAVLNTNLSTAAALLTWVFMDMGSKYRKPTFLGAVNGMIVGLVGITPAAGYVNGWGALAIGVIGSVVVWFSFNKLSKKWIFAKVDDALGVVHTHGVAGLMGGLMTGLFADPKMIVYLGSGKASDVVVKGLLYGHPWQFMLQLFAGLWVIGYSAIGTFLLLKLIKLFIPLRFPDEILEVGDLAIHGEQVEPTESAHRVIPAASGAQRE
ncbi:MAG: ammonium transporter [Actinomycetota bacterium]|jgi:Amt family ammonium transporter|nr:ammonium transporter [Actinomycetota bacterium]